MSPPSSSGRADRTCPTDRTRRRARSAERRGSRRAPATSNRRRAVLPACGLRCRGSVGAMPAGRVRLWSRPRRIGRTLGHRASFISARVRPSRQSTRANGRNDCSFQNDLCPFPTVPNRLVVRMAAPIRHAPRRTLASPARRQPSCWGVGEAALAPAVLLSSTMLVGALTGYGGRAYGACADTGGPTYSAPAPTPPPAAITVNNAAVSTRRRLQRQHSRRQRLGDYRRRRDLLHRHQCFAAHRPWHRSFMSFPPAMLASIPAVSRQDQRHLTGGILRHCPNLAAAL